MSAISNRSRRVPLAAVLATALFASSASVPASVTHGAATWKVIGSASARGHLSLLSAQGLVGHPAALKLSIVSTPVLLARVHWTVICTAAGSGDNPSELEGNTSAKTPLVFQPPVPAGAHQAMTTCNFYAYARLNGRGAASEKLFAR